MKRLLSFLLLPLFLLTAGCAPQQSQEQFFAMDTLMSVTAYGRDGAAGALAARQAVERLDRLLSRTDPDSQISQLNAAAGSGTAVELDSDTAELLVFAKELAGTLPGDFDVTIAPVMDAWGFTGEDRHVPSEEALAAALELVDSSALKVEGTSARLETAGMAVDLGAVAKGYAAAKAQAALEEAGVDCALLDLGRNITLVGSRTDGSPWRVAVADPEDDSQHLCILSLTDATASTSGGYERWFEEDGVRYHHIIDPKTGWPAQSGLRSVTVISADPLLADGLSTALFVAGEAAALDYWRSREDFELVLCTEDGRVVVTGGLEDALEFTGEELGYVCEIARR